MVVFGKKRLYSGKSGCGPMATVTSLKNTWNEGPNLPSKMGLKKCFLLQQLECRCGPTATVTFLIKHFKKSGLAPETMLRTQRSRPFPKPEKWYIFGILAKGAPHENFLERFNFTNG